MRSTTILSVLIAGATLGQPALAFVLGGGAADSDCRAGFGGVDATDGQSGVATDVVDSKHGFPHARDVIDT